MDSILSSYVLEARLALTKCNPRSPPKSEKAARICSLSGSAAVFPEKRSAMLGNLILGCMDEKNSGAE
ncbi:MAG: hypothetical protein ACHQ03_11015 [Candidatus Bathyarchaeia archaeon]